MYNLLAQSSLMCMFNQSTVIQLYVHDTIHTYNMLVCATSFERNSFVRPNNVNWIYVSYIQLNIIFVPLWSSFEI